jgi:hypothetical protein
MLVLLHDELKVPEVICGKAKTTADSKPRGVAEEAEVFREEEIVGRLGRMAWSPDREVGVGFWSRECNLCVDSNPDFFVFQANRLVIS